jgi:hypothetical protein
MNNLSIKKTGNLIGILSVVFFVLCMFWGILLTDPVLKELHVNILRIVFPGFTMSFIGTVIGTVESFIYGWVFGVLLAWLCRKICVTKINKS